MDVQGFSWAAVEAGIRYSGRPDLALIVSAVPAVTSGVFTTNIVKAAPVRLDRQRLAAGIPMRAILANSGNANACTGEQGERTAAETAALVAAALKISPEEVLVASTGVIGEPMSMEPFAAAVPDLVGRLAPSAMDTVARAIMTTDTRPKTASIRMDLGDSQVTVAGVAKGAGMIMPDMATMLAFIVTDAAISRPCLDSALAQGTADTFNRITVDGDTSTNDTVLVMANGLAGNRLIDGRDSDGYARFSKALRAVMEDLATQIVADGEGATKLVTITVRGSENDREARLAARTAANSLLVKTAFFGEDANWGRIIAAIGRSGCRMNPDRVSIAFDDVTLVRNGTFAGKEMEDRAAAVLRQKQFTVTVDLHLGPGSASVLTCDLSHDYVRINADYRS